MAVLLGVEVLNELDPCRGIASGAFFDVTGVDPDPTVMRGALEEIFGT